MQALPQQKGSDLNRRLQSILDSYLRHTSCTNYCYDRFVSHETPNFFLFLFSTKICTWGWGTRLRLVRKTWKTFSLSTTYTLVNCKHSFCKREHQVIIDIFELHYKFSQKYPDISNRQLKTYISMHIFGYKIAQYI